MTREEAIKNLQMQKDLATFNPMTGEEEPWRYAQEIEALEMAIKALKQEPKTGQWIDGKCNRCGTHAPFWAMASAYYLSEYCPHCGAKMNAESEERDADSN